VTNKYLIRSLSLISLLGLVLLSACSGDNGESSEHAADVAASEAGPDNPTGAVVGGNKGNLAPNFNLKNIAGGQLALSSLRGKAVLVDFWDTWCPPCRKALPALDAISQAYPDDLVVVGVAFGRDGEEKVRQYVAQNNLTFPMVLTDENFQVAKDFGGVQSIPTTFLIDRNGLIVEKWVGGHSREVYEAGVKKVLGS
jgi:peroxiredoxin